MKTKRRTTRKLALCVVVPVISALMLGCQTLKELPTLQGQIDELRAEQENIKSNYPNQEVYTDITNTLEQVESEYATVLSNYSELSEFLDVVVREAELNAPADFVQFLNDSRAGLDSAIATAQGQLDELPNMTAEAVETIHLERDTIVAEWQVQLAGLQAFVDEARAGIAQTIDDAQRDLQERVAAADTRHALAVRGLEAEFSTYQNEISSEVRTYIRAIDALRADFLTDRDAFETSIVAQLDEHRAEVDSMISTFIRGVQPTIDAFVEEQMERERALYEEIDQKMAEIRILAVGRDSILQQVESQIRILASSLEQVSRELSQH